MTTLLSLLSGAAVHDLGWTLVHFLWQGALLALLLEALLPFLRGARARHNLALAVLALMLAAPLVTFFFLHTPQSPMPAGGAVMTILGGASVIATGDAPATPAPDWTNWLVLAWAAGFALFCLRAFGSWYLADNLRRRDVSTLPEELLARCRTLALRLGVKGPVQFLASARVSVPVVVGWLKPVVLLPLSALAGLSPQQLDALVLHELAHIRRYDAFINILLLAAETVLFYHPAVWWVSRRIRNEREHCCDDLAVAHCGDAFLYAEALTSMASSSVARGLVLAARGGVLKARVARLLELPRARARYGLPSIAGVVMAVLLVATVAMAQSVVVTTRDTPPMGEPLAALPDNAVIHHIMFRGNGKISVKDLAWEIFLRDGAAVTAAKIENDVTRLRELYRRNGKYFARIEPRVIPMAESHVQLVFNISEGPTVGIAKIAFIGNKAFDDATLKAQLATHESAWYRPLSNDDNYDPDRVMYDRVLLQNFYTAHGHPEVRIPPVEAQLTPDQRNFIITFRIDEDGKQAVVFPPPAAFPPSISINVKGVSENNAAGFPIFYQGDVMMRQGDVAIRANTVRLLLPPSSRSWNDVTRLVFAGDVTLTTPSGTVQSQTLAVDVADGQFQVSPPAVRKAQLLPGGTPALDFPVSEGIRYNFGKIAINSTLPELTQERLMPLLKLQGGDVYNSLLVRTSLDALAKAAGAAALVTPRLERDAKAHTIDVTFIVEDRQAAAARPSPPPPPGAVRAFRSDMAVPPPPGALRRTQLLPGGTPFPPPPGAKVDYGMQITDDKGVAPPINIRADKATKSTPEGPPTLYEGHALLTQGDVMVRANSIRVETVPGSAGPGQKIARLVAEGDVLFASPHHAVPAEHMVILVIDHRLQLAQDTLDPGTGAPRQ